MSSFNFDRSSTRGSKPPAPRSTAFSPQLRSAAPTAAHSTPKRNDHPQQAANSRSNSSHASSSTSAPADVVAYLQGLNDRNDSNYQSELQRLKKQWRFIENQLQLISPSTSPVQLSPVNSPEVGRTPAPPFNVDSKLHSSSFSVGNGSAPASRASAAAAIAAAAAAKRSPANHSSSSGGAYTPAATGAVRDKHYSSSTWVPSPAAAEAVEFEPSSSTDATALRYKTKIVLRGCRSRCLRAMLSSDPLNAGIYTLEADGVGTGSPDEALLLVKVCSFTLRVSCSLYLREHAL
jgi:hypothetical protein